ncbi:MAG TPA: DUF3015 family protein [Deltaproteobacteria bacterium]|nr:DUF3015 family protein [Deltaproteobacteria bacterium]
MKRFMAAAALVVFLALPATVCLAGQSNTGCGLGSVIFKGQEGLLFQVLAVTTNGTFGNQTFGITSGTLNCAQPSRFASNERINTYVSENMDNLANDIARGQGEYLNTLAVLMDVPEGSRTAFYTTLQGNFSRIYTSSSVTSTDVVRNIEALM